jgi:hypothetical protein
MNTQRIAWLAKVMGAHHIACRIDAEGRLMVQDVWTRQPDGWLSYKDSLWVEESEWLDATDWTNEAVAVWLGY